jgi:hypothetical protein
MTGRYLLAYMESPGFKTAARPVYGILNPDALNALFKFSIPAAGAGKAAFLRG